MFRVSAVGGERGEGRCANVWCRGVYDVHAYGWAEEEGFGKGKAEGVMLKREVVVTIFGPWCLRSGRGGLSISVKRRCAGFESDSDCSFH